MALAGSVVCLGVGEIVRWRLAEEMSKVDVNIIRPHWEFLKSCEDSRFVCLYGGASSGKSWTMAAWLLGRLFSEKNKGFLVLRKTRPAVRKSCYRLVKHWLGEWGLPYRENKTELILTSPTGSWMQFEGLDDVAKLKSIEGVNYIWLEEATEFTYLEFLQLHIRCRAKNEGLNQINFTFNPVDPVGNQWLEDITKKAPAGELLGSTLRVMQCTHTDNPFLAKEERDGIEALADADPEYDKIYRQGLWATPTAIIYSGWDTIEEFPDHDKLDDIGYGLDFGYVNPSALVKVGIRENDLYVEEMLHEKGLHNRDLIGRLHGLIHDQLAVIVGDSAEPAYIDEIAEAGWNVHGCVKAEGQGGKSFVNTGIDRVKRFHMHVIKSSTNIIEELRGYKWKSDRAGNVLPEPVKFKDHGLDALRYYVGSRPEEITTEVIQLPDWLREQLQ